MSTTTSSLPLTSGTWPVDAAHSSVEFTVRHLGLSKVRGRFNDFDATLTVGSSLDDVAVTATIGLASVDTNNADRDAHLRSTDFFDTESHPRMTFVSTAITDRGDGSYGLTGDLSLNGVTQTVVLDVEFNGTEDYPMDGSVHAGFSATGVLSRKSFGIEFDVPLGADKVAIGDKVNLDLEIQFVRP
ncbi:MAG: YceI family protein [Acidimicrobiales bacterium]